MTKKILKLRVGIDSISQLVQGLRETGNISDFEFNSPECSKCYDSLIFSKAWLGKILGELGQETPYKNDGKRKTENDIEDTADTANMNHDDEFNENWRKKTYIEKVDWIREDILKTITMNLQYTQEYQKEWIAVYSLRADQHLCEARFWLGFELQRIKEQV